MKQFVSNSLNIESTWIQLFQSQINEYANNAEQRISIECGTIDNNDNTRNDKTAFVRINLK